MMFMRRIATLLLAGLSVSAFGSICFAKEVKKVNPQVKILESLLLGETWGAGKDSVLAMVKEGFDNVWRAKASKMDAFDVDQEIRKSQERYQEVVSSYSELDQNGVEFLASPLKGEFGLGLDQSLLRVPNSKGDRYFLFQEARLAKFIEIVPASKFKNFGAFSSAQRKRLKLKKLAACPKANLNDGSATQGRSAEKAIPLLAACVMDRTRLYNAYLLVVTDPSTTWSRLSKEQAGNDELAGLPDIFSEDPSAEDNQELVDELTGTKAKETASKTPKSTKTSSKKRPTKPGVKQKGERKTEKGLYDDQDVLY
jgi:hypothetical protein